MNAALVDKIVKAVLYEGYMLYPYRPSAVKNRQRFNFGVLYPRTYTESPGSTDSWTMQTECLVVGSDRTQCIVRVRFLRMVERSIGKLLTPATELSSVNKENIENVQRLEVDAKVFQPWQEAVEEEIEVTEFNLSALTSQSMQWPFRLSAKKETEPIRDARGSIAGIIQRDRECLAGAIDLSAAQFKPGVFKLTACISNASRIESAGQLTRDHALAQSLVSTHTILEVLDGEFISMVDPPELYHDDALACQNVGTWPILVGEPGQRDTLLSSPIILYDYPQIAPESPGDLFDGAEIDEILSLRIMTMTEDEKREMRQSDERTRQILERTETLPEEQFIKLHGALRGLHAANAKEPQP